MFLSIGTAGILGARESKGQDSPRTEQIVYCWWKLVLNGEVSAMNL
jgi:hypothetical protein